jgi:hypothetical protein
MNRGILQTALTTTQRLDLDYWEAFVFHENGERVEKPTDIPSVERELAGGFACLLNVI